MTRITAIALAASLGLGFAAPAEAGIRRYGTFPIIEAPAEAPVPTGGASKPDRAPDIAEPR